MISDTGVEDPVGDTAFKARALAQAHPLSSTGHAYRQSVIAVERADQPLPEFADWAATAFLVGYCVRRVEEAESAPPGGGSSITEPATDPATKVDLHELAATTQRLADDVRHGRPAGVPLFEPSMVAEVLNRIIGTEIDKRVDHWKAEVSASDWADFEQYIAWWVVHGYASRAAELVPVTEP